MRTFMWVPSAAVLIVGMLVMGAKPAAANPDWTKKERKQCIYCHVGAWDSGKYTEAGQYYKDHEFSFKGFVAKPDAGKSQAAKKTDDKH
jgi:hypothetical protein